MRWASVGIMCLKVGYKVDEMLYCIVFLMRFCIFVLYCIFNEVLYFCIVNEILYYFNVDEILFF